MREEQHVFVDRDRRGEHVEGQKGIVDGHAFSSRASTAVLG